MCQQGQESIDPICYVDGWLTNPTSVEREGVSRAAEQLLGCRADAAAIWHRSALDGPARAGAG